MHELSIAQNIFDIIEETMTNEKGKVLEVVVDVGELIAVVPESLEFCYGVIIENSRFAGSKLLINIIPIKARCQSCKTEFIVENITFVCPECNSIQLDVLQGQELTISHLEVQ